MPPDKIAYYLNRFYWVNQFIPNKYTISLHSMLRRFFMQQFLKDRKISCYNKIQNIKPRILWGIKFNLPIFNAAGIFKNAESYNLIASQGAGAYLGGSSTYNARIGNKKYNILHPFISLGLSHSAINYLGLPNMGDEILSQKQYTQNKIDGCPIGWSMALSPDFTNDIALEYLIKGLFLYENNLQIDFIEINLSCPNVNNKFDNLEYQLAFIAKNFLLKRSRHLPIIIKLSNDTLITDLPKLLNLLFKYKFDGINLGNTSTEYDKYKINIHSTERKLYEYFVKNFGGGLSGMILKHNSLKLASRAKEYCLSISPDYEFHVIRTGGIFSMQDIIESDQAGISMNQWYTGYLYNYSLNGNLVYKKLFMHN